MSATFIATLAGLATALFWGTSDYLSARSTKKLSPIQINFALQLASIVVVGIIYSINGVQLHNGGEVARIAISSLLINFAFIVFVKALSGGVVGIIVPLGNIYPLFTILLTIIFLKTHFSVGQIAAMIVIVLGAVLLAYEKNHANIPIRQLHQKSFLALLAAVIWGVGFFVVSPLAGKVSWQSISVVSEGFSLIFAIAMMLISSKWKVIIDTKEIFGYRPALIAGIFGELGLMALYLGSGRSGSIVIPAVLSATGPLVASLWGALFDHEKVGLAKRAGAIVTVIGIVVLNLS